MFTPLSLICTTESMNYHAAKAYILDRLGHQLDENLTYHSLSHTLDVLNITEELCLLEKISVYETMLLKTAALFHDSGFLINNKNHEELGCGIVREVLPRYDYTEIAIQKICDMIMATKIPQSPKNNLEKIICDADLDYLGRDDFYKIGNKLFQELKTYHVLSTETDWNQLQVKFIGAHHFFTTTNRTRREPKKQQHLKALKNWLLAHEVEI